MGKRAREEREERRESFASQRRRAKRKNTLLTAAILGTVAVIVGVSAYNFATNAGNVVGAPPGAGQLGSEHVHASLLTAIHGDAFDYSGPAFQTQSPFIHFESRDGATVHRHATGVTMGFLFESIEVGIEDGCFTWPDRSRVFCTDDEHSLLFYVNGDRVPSISDYVFDDGDRILVYYGADDEAAVAKELRSLEAQPILA